MYLVKCFLLNYQFNIILPFARWNVIKYRKWIHICNWRIDVTIIGITITIQSRSEWSVSGCAFHIPQKILNWSLTIRWFSVLSRTFSMGVLLFCLVIASSKALDLEPQHQIEWSVILRTFFDLCQVLSGGRQRQIPYSGHSFILTHKWNS